MKISYEAEGTFYLGDDNKVVRYLSMRCQGNGFLVVQQGEELQRLRYTES